MYKIAHYESDKWVAHHYAPIYSITPTSSGTPRIKAGASGNASLIFERLGNCLSAPYGLLYILHTPRGEGKAGRYQSPLLSAEQFHQFMLKFSGFLSSDARFDIWIHSPSENATVIWDRHDLLFAYGPIKKISSELNSLGYSEGVVDANFTHQHYYREECDAQALAILNEFSWGFSPLRPEDEQ